jgi:hypothetical protein
MTIALGCFLLIAPFLLSAASQAQSPVASREVDFTVPSGYAAKTENALLWLVPQNPADVRTPCVYGFAPPLPSKASLEADAEAALVETIAGGMRRTSDYRIARRGVAAGGWPYFLTGGHFQGQFGGQNADLAVMAMVFPASAGRLHVLFGIGNPAGCTFNDVPFAELFHSLRPRGWSSPAGNALERDLIGAWGGSRLSGHTFLADGRYSSSAAGALFGSAVSGATNGRYALRGSEISITPGIAGQAPERFHVDIYDTWNNSRWQRAMTVLYDDRKPPYVAEYVREGP